MQTEQAFHITSGSTLEHERAWATVFFGRLINSLECDVSMREDYSEPPSEV